MEKKLEDDPRYEEEGSYSSAKRQCLLGFQGFDIEWKKAEERATVSSRSVGCASTICTIYAFFSGTNPGLFLHRSLRDFVTW